MRHLILAAALLLAACTGVPGGGLFAPSGTPSLALYDGALTVAGAEAYCVDTRVSRPASGFAVLASCARTAGARLHPQIDGLVIAQVGEAGSALVAGNEAALADVLQSDDGAALMEGTATRVVTGAGTVLVRLQDRETTGATGAPLWRVFFDLGDRSVTATIRPFADVPLDPTAARSVLETTVAAIRAAN